MEYEPLKLKINRLLDRLPVLRRLFYLILDAFILRQWYVKRAIRESVKSKKGFHVYDAGTGFGQYSHYILKQFPQARVLSVDINAHLMNAWNKFALKKWSRRVKIERADLQTYVPESKQDLILAIDILEHIEDDLAVLQNFRKCLNVQGVLIISTPYATKEAGFTAEHFRDGYTEEDLRDKLNKSGFQADEIRYSYGFWGNLAWYLTTRIPLAGRRCFWFIVLSPIYFLISYPLALMMMLIDYHSNNRRGRGMIFKCRLSD